MRGKKTLKSVTRDGCQTEEITLKDVTSPPSHSEEAAGRVTHTSVSRAPRKSLTELIGHNRRQESSDPI